MATMLDEESLSEPKRTSLLDVAEEKIRQSNRKRLLHRVFLVSKLRSLDIDKDALGGHYDTLYKNMLSFYQGEATTGLMLIYPGHCLQILETSTEMLLGLLRDIIADEEDENGYLVNTNILNISHDLPSRLFSQWTYRVLDMQATNIDLYEPSDEPAKLITDTLTQCLNLAKHISALPKLNWKNTMDNLREKIPDLLPQQMILGYLSTMEDKCMVKMRDLVRMYQEPYDVVLEGELVWPIAIRLFPYN